MRPSRREVREMGHGERYRAQPVAPGIGGSRRLRAARDACRARRTGTPPSAAPAASTASPRSPAPSSMRRIFVPPICRVGRRRPRTPSWFARRTPPTSIPEWISRALSGAAKPSVVVTAADLDKIGTRVPEFYAGDLFCPIGKTPIYMGQPVALLIFETFDAFDQARLALRDGTFVKFGEETGPVAMPELRRLPLYARGRRNAGRARCLFADAGGLGQPWKIRRTSALPVWSPLAKDTQAPYAKAATYGEQIRAELAAKDPDAAGAGPRVRDPVGRSDVSRAGMRPRLVQRQERQASNSCSACSLRMRPRNRLRICSARRKLPSSRRISTPSSPMSAAASADATTRRSCFTWHWRRCFFPAVRFGWRMIAISSFRAASSATLSRCGRASGSTERPERSGPLRPIMCSTAAGSPISRPTWRRAARPPRSASMMFRKSTSPPLRCIRAA